MFRLTPQVMSLAVAYLGTDLVATVLQPACERIMAMTGESCFVGVLVGEDMMMIANANRQFPLGLVPSIGLGCRRCRPPPAAFCSVCCRTTNSTLALQGDAEGEHEVHVDRSKALRETILKGREDGYCITRQEAMLDFCAIAVPLRRADGKAVGFTQRRGAGRTLCRQSRDPRDLAQDPGR